jgi:hypothetical protein
MMIKQKIGKNLFRVDFFRLYNEIYRKILFSVAIKYGFNVSHLKNAVCYQMGFDAVTEAATMDFFYLFSLFLLGNDICGSDKKKINMTLSIYNKRMHNILHDKNKYNLMYLCDNEIFSGLNIKNSSYVCNKVFLVRNHNNREFKVGCSGH